jgi:hypothetical protein
MCRDHKVKENIEFNILQSSAMKRYNPNFYSW